MLEYALIFLFPFAMVFAGVNDLLAFTISNRICLILIGGFWTAALLTGLPCSTLFNHLVAGTAVIFIGFALFARGMVGGGDAKLAAAATLWLGFEHLLPFLFWTALLGGALALVLLTYRRILPPVWLLGQSWAMRLHDSREGIPYGVAIAGAGLIVYPQTIWMTGIAG